MQCSLWQDSQKHFVVPQDTTVDLLQRMLDLEMHHQQPYLALEVTPCWDQKDEDI